MIKLKKLLETAEYQSNCVNDERTAQIFDDANNMQYAISQSDVINYNEFIGLVDISETPRLFKLHLRTKPNEFSFGKHKNLIWAYDDVDDIHYFFI